MEPKKIGLFLKELRKEKKLTQGQLAEHLNMSDRTVSRWETGTTLPDLPVLVELADFYGVDIREIIDGERKSEKMKSEEMQGEMRDTLEKVTQYAGEEKEKQLGRMKKGIGAILAGFGAFLILSAFVVFPSESGWGAKFAILGAILGAAGVFKLLKKHRISVSIGVFLATMLCLIVLDFVSVCHVRQAPRFAYSTDYGETMVTYYAPLYSVVRYDRNTADERYEVRIGNKILKE